MSPRTRDTRERILEEAAVLFTRRGFHGTSTRDIANAVGIRQQSVFHHFEHKQAILAQLLDRDLDPTIARLRRLRRHAARPSAQLYAHLVLDVETILTTPFDSRGIYNDDVLREPGLEAQRSKRTRLHGLIKGLVRDGINASELLVLDPQFVQQAITGLTLETMWVRGAKPGRSPSARPYDVADFVLRSILSRRLVLEHVRAEATPLIEVERGYVTAADAVASSAS